MTLRKIKGLTQFLRMTKASLSAFDSAIPNGILVFANDTQEIKFGNGTSKYDQLPLFMDLNKARTTYLSILPMLDILTIPSLPDDIDKIVIVNSELKIDYGSITMTELINSFNSFSSNKMSQDIDITNFGILLGLLTLLVVDDEGKLVIVKDSKYATDENTISLYIEDVVKNSISTYLFSITDIEFYTTSLCDIPAENIISLNTYYAVVKTNNDVDGNSITNSLTCSNPNVLITKDPYYDNRFEVIIPELFANETDAFVASCNNGYMTKNFTKNVLLRVSLDVFGVLNILFFEDIDCTIPLSTVSLIDDSAVNGEYYAQVKVSNPNNSEITYGPLVVSSAANDYAFEWLDFGDFSWINTAGFSWINTLGETLVTITQIGTSDTYMVEIADIQNDLPSCIFTVSIYDEFDTVTYDKEMDIIDAEGNISIISIQVFKDQECTIEDTNDYLIDRSDNLGTYFFKVIILNKNGFVLTENKLETITPDIRILKYGDDNSSTFRVDIADMSGDINEVIFTATVNDGYGDKTLSISRKIYDIVGGFSITSIDLFSNALCTVPVLTTGLIDNTAINGLYYAKITAVDSHGFPISCRYFYEDNPNVTTTKVSDNVFSISIADIQDNQNVIFTAVMSNSLIDKSMLLPVTLINPENGLGISSIGLYIDQELTTPATFMRELETYYIKVFAEDTNLLDIEYQSLAITASGYEFMITHRTDIHDSVYEVFTPDIASIASTSIVATVTNGHSVVSKTLIVDTVDPLNDFRILDIEIYSDIECTLPIVGNLFDETTYYVKVIAEDDNGYDIDYNSLTISIIDSNVTITKVEGIDDPRFSMTIGNVNQDYTDIILTVSCDNGYASTSMDKAINVDDGDADLVINSIDIFTDDQFSIPAPTRLNKNTTYYAKITAVQSNSLDITYGGITDNVYGVSVIATVDEFDHDINEYRIEITDIMGTFVTFTAFCSDGFGIKSFIKTVEVIDYSLGLSVNDIKIYDNPECTGDPKEFIYSNSLVGGFSYLKINATDVNGFTINYSARELTPEEIIEFGFSDNDIELGTIIEYVSSGVFKLTIPDIPSSGYLYIQTTASTEYMSIDTLIGINVVVGTSGLKINSLLIYEDSNFTEMALTTSLLMTPVGTYAGSGAFFGGVLMNDGRIFCNPCNSTTARIYDPVSNTLSTPTGIYPGSSAFSGVLKLNDGRVFCVPSYSTTARIYDPVNDETIIPSGTYPGDGAFHGGVLMGDGRVFCVPLNSTTARIYDPVTDTLSIPDGEYPGVGSFGGGVLLDDGRVFCVPLYSGFARIYDPVSNTLITTAGTYPGGASFIGGVLMNDGRVFCIPHASTTARIYDPVTDTLITPSGTYPGDASFHNGVLLDDGRVFCVPCNSTTARIYDPVTDTLIIPDGEYPGNLGFVGGVKLPDGSVFCVPHYSTSARLYDPFNVYNLFELTKYYLRIDGEDINGLGVMFSANATISNSAIVPYITNLKDNEFELSIGSLSSDESKEISGQIINTFGSKTISKQVLVKNASDWLVISSVTFYSDATCLIPVVYFNDLSTYYGKVIATNNGYEDQIEYQMTCNNANINIIQNNIDLNVFQIVIAELSSSQGVYFNAQCSTPYTVFPVNSVVGMMVNHDIGKLLAVPTNALTRDREVFNILRKTSSGDYLAIGLDNTNTGHLAKISWDFMSTLGSTISYDNIDRVEYKDAIESDGFIYVIGRKYRETGGYWRGFISKLDYSSMNLVNTDSSKLCYVTQFDANDTSFESITIYNGNLYIAGTHESDAIIVVIEASTLTLIDSKIFSISDNEISRFKKIEYDSVSNSLIAIGSTTVTTKVFNNQIYESFIVKVNTSLEILYQKVFQLNVNVYDGIEFTDFVIDGSDVIIIGKVMESLNGNYKGCIIKAGSDLQISSISLISRDQYGHSYLNGITKNANGDYLICGSNITTDSLYSEPIFMTISNVLPAVGVIATPDKIISQYSFGEYGWGFANDCIMNNNGSNVIIGNQGYQTPGSEAFFVLSLVPDDFTGSFTVTNPYLPWTLKDIESTTFLFEFSDASSIVEVVRVITRSVLADLVLATNLSFHGNYNLSSIVDSFD